MQETRVQSLSWEDSPGEGNGTPLQYSCLENPMDGGAWEAAQSMGSQRVGHDWVTSLSVKMMFNIFSDICCICLSSLEARRQESSLHWEDICKAKEYICTVCSLPLPILKLGYLVFLLLSYMSLLYVLNINPLSDIWCANIFSFSVACLSPCCAESFYLM